MSSTIPPQHPIRLDGEHKGIFIFLTLRYLLLRRSLLSKYAKFVGKKFKVFYRCHVHVTRLTKILHTYRGIMVSSVGIATGYGLDGPGIESR
jgi:hypothetical protein